MTRTDALLLAVAAALVVAGIAFIFWPLALIVAGLAIGVPVLLRDVKPDNEEPR